MNGHSDIHLLLIDDDIEFQTKARALGKLRFSCTTARNEEEMHSSLRNDSIDAVLIDLGLSSDDGKRLIKVIRRKNEQIPVIVMSEHVTPKLRKQLEALGATSVLEKPINLDELTSAIVSTLRQGSDEGFHEPTVTELMIAPELYPKVFLHESVTKAIKVLKNAFFDASGQEVRTRLRSALVFDRKGSFQGIVHLDDILRLVHPSSFEHSPYMSSFTGMFMNQARSLPRKSISDLLRDQPAISTDTPIMEAVHLMLENGLINLPVLEGEELVGILRDKDIILEIARILKVE
ncbi:response regulator [bacterium]|nr:response regulator [bacterium]